MGSCGFRYGCPKYHHHCLFSRVGSKLHHLCSRLHIPMTHITPGTRTRNGMSTANRGKAMLPTYTGACGCAGVRLCKPFKEEEKGEGEEE